MELRQLRHFITIAEEMHFGRAAERLHISQPALSASISRLEGDLRLRLLERDSKHVVLTFAGSEMLKHAREIVFSTDRARDFAHAMASGRAGRLEVGFTATLMCRGLDRILQRFKSQYPNVELGLREIPSRRQADMVRARKLDVGFVNSPVPPAGLAHQVLFDDRFVACLPASHRFAAREVLDFSLLREEPFIVFGHDPSPSYHDYIMGLCAAAGFYPIVAIETLVVLSVVTLVSQNLGVSIVPESLSKSGIPGVAYVPIQGAGRVPSAHVIWNSEVSTPGLDALVQCVDAMPAGEFA